MIFHKEIYVYYYIYIQKEISVHESISQPSWIKNLKIKEQSINLSPPSSASLYYTRIYRDNKQTRGVVKK